mmetsp:Transcript_26660/g.75674  ORF Transcript_26660/g.75674 Transcript_26660/m.75674 type:complete len:223 (-) Transcript_26660:151-819(-)
MGNANCCSIKAGTEELTALQLREALVGDSRKTKDLPEVWVSINSLTFKKEESKVFLAKFYLQGAVADVVVKIVGSDSQIVQELGSEVALRLMDRVGVSASLKQRGSEFYGNLPRGLNPKKVPGSSSLIEIKERPPHEGPDKVAGTSGGSSWDQGQESRSFQLSVVATLSKELEEREVSVEIERLEATTSGHRSVLSSDVLRNHVAAALSDKMSEVIRRGAKP